MVESEKPTLELTATVYNIAAEHNTELLPESQALSDYAVFVSMVENYRADGLPLSEAITKAIQECKKHCITAPYLESHGPEVFTEWIGVPAGSSDGSFVHTIEGNSGDVCRLNTHSINSSVVSGYGLTGSQLINRAYFHRTCRLLPIWPCPLANLAKISQKFSSQNFPSLKVFSKKNQKKFEKPLDTQVSMG
ncbi:MAG: hypothetical protein LBJ48_03465 [Coriobacteriales bacterium]|jgi:hypothetical protein|nr:hypothetical protein [Coriobacteriales bacterium]